MKGREKFRFGIAAVFVSGCLFGAFASAQEEDDTDPVVAYNKSVSAIQLQKWDEALALTNGVIAEHGEGALKRYGPVFGHFHFLKGLAHLGKNDLDGATASFQACYEKFSNEILDTGTDEETNGLLPNLFRNAALVQWGNAEMKREQYAKARDLYEKVLVEGAQDAKVNRIYVGVNLGRCYLKAGELEKGYEFMVRPLSSENLSDGLRETIYMVIAEDWSPEVEFPPVRAFIQEYSRVVDFDPFLDRYERNERFQYLAQVALERNDPVRALAWYERMVNPRKLVPDFQQRYEQLANRPVSGELEVKKKEVLAELQQQLDWLEKGYLQILNGVGSAHFMMQNFAGSYVAFSQLSDQAGPKHEGRPVFLHNAVVSAAQIEKWKEAYRYGKQFLDEFPDHELKPGVARVLVELLLIREEYEDAYKISGDVRESMEVGSEMRDIPDFVRAASAFHLGYMEEAETELSTYFKVHEQGERLEMAQFFLGLSKVQLAKWEDAATILNDFLAKYETSPLVPPVLYQCALSEFMIDQPEAALAKTDRIHADFSSHEVSPPSWNLTGDIRSSLEAPFEEIVPAYEKGRDGGREMGQAETAAYALWQLVVQTVDHEDWEAAERHYTEFQEKHAESEYRHDLLVASLPMLVEQGRTEEGIEKLRTVVWNHRDQPESAALAEMFGSYVDFVETHADAETLRNEMTELRERRGTTPTLLGWTTVALVDLLEKTETPQEEINKLFYRLEAGFNPAVQSNYPIVRLARWITDVRKKPEDAKPLYEFVLENRPGTPNYEYCLIDVAEIEARSEDAAERESAMKKFEQVLAIVPDEELQEKAVLGMARIRNDEENFEEAKSLWERYLENRGWTLARAEANYRLAHCHDKLGDLSTALKIYVSVYANFPGHLDWSTRAYLRTAAITKGTGEDLKALKILQDMLQRMGHLDHPGVKKAKEVFAEWRQEYAAKAAAQNP